MMNVIALARIKLLDHLLFVKFSLLGHKLKWLWHLFWPGKLINIINSRAGCHAVLPGYPVRRDVRPRLGQIALILTIRSRSS